MARLFHLNLLTLSFFPFLISGLLSLLERPRPRAAAQTGIAFALQAATSGYHAFSCVLVSLAVGAFEFRRFARAQDVGSSPPSPPYGGSILLYPYVSGFLFLREHEARMLRDARVPCRLRPRSVVAVRQPELCLAAVAPEGVQPFFPGLVVLVLRRPGPARLEAGPKRPTPGCRRAHLPCGRGWSARSAGPARRLRRDPWPCCRRPPRSTPCATRSRSPCPRSWPWACSRASVSRRSALARSRPAVVLTCSWSPGPRRSALPLPTRWRPTRPPSVYGWLAGQPPGGILELPFRDTGWTWWAAHHQLPIVNGIGAFEPERYQALWQLVKRDWQGPAGDLEGTRALAYLKAWFPIRYVVVHESANNDAPRARRRDEAELRPPARELEEGDRVYGLVRRGEGHPAAPLLSGRPASVGPAASRPQRTSGHVTCSSA